MNEFKIKKGLIVNGSGSTILDIQGSQGQLFSVTDQLSGSLFSVNDISGIPILEVFSDNSVNLGTFGSEAIIVEGSTIKLPNTVNDTGDFVTVNGNNEVGIRTPSQVLSDIGAQASLTNPITGTGTTNYISKWTGTNTQGNSIIFDNGTNVGIGTTSPVAKLHVSADIIVNGINVGRGGSNISTNTRVGQNALLSNTTGDSNTANGFFALQNNTTGGSNTANGAGALFSNTTGGSNTANGVDAGRYIADGSTENITTNNSVFIGTSTKALANNQTNQIVIGHDATGLGSNTVVLGNNSIVTTALKGNVGIGTSSPTTKLDVNGDVTITDKIIHKNDDDTFISFPTNDTIRASAGDLNQLEVNASGGGRMLVKNQLHAGGLNDFVNSDFELHDGVSSIVRPANFLNISLLASGNILTNQVAAENIIAGQLIYLTTTSPRWDVASASSSGRVDRFIGIALNDALQLEELDVLVEGIINYNNNNPYHEQLSSPTIGAPLYASTSNGRITEDAPSSSGNIVKVLGHNISKTTDIVVVRFNPDNTWIEI